MMIGRRGFLAGLFVAPAIIRPGLLMPVRKWIEPAYTSGQLVGSSPTDTFTMSAIREAIEILRRNSVPAINGYYHLHQS